PHDEEPEAGIAPRATPAPPRPDPGHRQPGERRHRQSAEVVRRRRVPAHLLHHVVGVAADEEPTPPPELVEMPRQDEGEKGERRGGAGADWGAAGARRRDPVGGEHGRRAERQGALREEGETEPRPRLPKAAAAAREAVHRGEEAGEREADQRRIKKERAAEADEPGREGEDRAGRESHAILEEDGAQPPADEARGDRERDTRQSRAPRRDAEKPEGDRRNPDDEGRLVEVGLPREIERAPVTADEDRLRDRG